MRAFLAQGLDGMGWDVCGLRPFIGWAACVLREGGREMAPTCGGMHAWSVILGAC